MRLYNLQCLSCCFVNVCRCVNTTSLQVSLQEKLAPDLVDARCCQSWHAQLLSLEMYLFSASLVRLFVADIYFCYLSCTQRKNMQVVETQHVVAERDPACSSKEPPLCFWCS